MDSGTPDSGTPDAGGTDASTPDGGAPRSKFMQTFIVFQRGFPMLVPGDEVSIAKFDLFVTNKHRYSEINGDTWGAVRALNPNIKILIYQQGVDDWVASDADDIMTINNISRYDLARGHSMGNLDTDNPDLFLKTSTGDRVLSYPGYPDSVRYLMDFGDAKFQQYWLEATVHDIVQQPWAGDGVFLDNCAPFYDIFPSTVPVKYPTNMLWGAAMNSYVNGITQGLHDAGMEVMTNTGGLADPDGVTIDTALDRSAFPPDVMAEEVAWVHSAGSADSTFESEDKWLRHLDFLSQAQFSRQAYFTSSKLSDANPNGMDNLGNPVTFKETLWYAMASYQLGRRDNPNNAYLFFFSIDTGYTPLHWFDEYDAIDLGAAVGSYQVTVYQGNNIYWREFEKGYVFVNPTATDVASITLPTALQELTPSSYTTPSAVTPAATLSLQAHRGRFLLKP